MWPFAGFTFQQQMHALSRETCLSRCTLRHAEAQEIYEDLEAPILATHEVADIVEAVQTLQVCLHGSVSCQCVTSAFPLSCER